VVGKRTSTTWSSRPLPLPQPTASVPAAQAPNEPQSPAIGPAPLPNTPTRLISGPSGSAPSVFFRSTVPSAAILRAMSACSGGFAGTWKLIWPT